LIVLSFKKEKIFINKNIIGSRKSCQVIGKAGLATLKSQLFRVESPHEKRGGSNSLI
jgi:hypothetical protein